MGILDSVDWKPTLILNVARAFCAGVVWSLIVLMSEGVGANFFIMLFAFPLSYCLVILPVGIAARKLSDSGVAWAGVVAAVCSVMVFIGDPLLFLLKKWAPRLVPVDDFKVINRVLVFLLYKRLPA
jgi:hypothetical protein